MDEELAHRKASTYTGQHNTEECKHISMSLAGFEPTIPLFERFKTVRVLGRAVTGTYPFMCHLSKWTKR